MQLPAAHISSQGAELTPVWHQHFIAGRTSEATSMVACGSQKTAGEVISGYVFKDLETQQSLRKLENGTVNMPLPGKSWAF